MLSYGEGLSRKIEKVHFLIANLYTLHSVKNKNIGIYRFSIRRRTWILLTELFINKKTMIKLWLKVVVYLMLFLWEKVHENDNFEIKISIWKLIRNTKNMVIKCSTSYNAYKSTKESKLSV